MELTARNSTLHSMLKRFSLLQLSLVVSIAAIAFALAAWQHREPVFPIMTVVHPVASPSGDKVAFVAIRGGQGAGASSGVDSDTISCQLSVLSRTNGRIKHTQAEVGFDPYPMTWGSSESNLIFVSKAERDRFPGLFGSLKSLNLRSSQAAQISPGYVDRPRASPDLQYIGYIFSNTTTGSSSLKIKHLQTAQETEVHPEINAYHWCWGPNSNCIYYLKDSGNGGLAIARYDLKSMIEMILFSAIETDIHYPSHLIVSPDDLHLGFQYGDNFRLFEIESGATALGFKCDYYFQDFVNFDWNKAGICYLDSVAGKREKGPVRLMVYNPDTRISSLIATGAFAYPSWLDERTILVRKGDNELWAYDALNGKCSMLYRPACK